MMLKQFVLIVSIFSMSCIAGYDCLAQKAFETVVYQGKITGTGNIRLDLADGYLPGSIVTLEQPKKDTLRFLPENGEPDNSGRWAFELAAPGKEKQQIVLFLKREKDRPPLKISAQYIVDKIKSKTVLRPITPR